MGPRRKAIIGDRLITEYYWAGKMVTYVNHRKTDELFDEAVKRLQKEYNVKKS